MALRLHILLNKVFYEPGEAVYCTAQVYNDSDATEAAPAYVRELVFQSNGSERTDPNWIQKLFRPEAKIEQHEHRRGVRTLFKTGQIVLQRDIVVPPLGAHQFTIKFRLPQALPPSFRGSSIRFYYTINVKALYEVKRGGTSSMYETDATTSILVWPSLLAWPAPAPQQAGREGMSLNSSGGGAAPSAGSTGDAAAAGQGRAAPAQSPQSDDADAPMVEYKLQQLIKVKFKEVPVDELLLLGGPSASVLGPNTFRAFTSIPGTSAPPTPSDPNPPLHSENSGSTTPAARPSGGGGDLLPNRFSLRHRRAQDELSDDSGWSDEEEEEGQGRDGDKLEGDMLSVSAQRQVSTSGYASSKVQGLVTQRTSLPPRPNLFGRIFTLNAGEHPVLNISIQAPQDTPLQPGSSFSGLLDLRPLGALAAHPARCLQVVVMLETEEVIAAEHRSRPGAPGVIRKLYGEHQEVTCDLVSTHFMFSIPTSATPSFRTPMASLRWVLRFELAVDKSPPGSNSGRAPQLQQLSWALPLLVQAPTM